MTKFVTVMLCLLLSARLGSSSKVPLYYGWFLESDGEKHIQEIATSFYDQLRQKPEAVSEMLGNFQIEGNSSSSLKTYFTREDLDSASATLHVTAMYCGRGTVPECKPYMANPKLLPQLDKESNIEVIGFVITPKTMGARVHLTSDQLDVWGQNDTEGASGTAGKCCDNLHLAENLTKSVGNFQPNTGKGSRAHITLSCAKGVSPVQTGYDVVAAVNCEEHCKTNADYFSLTGGQGRYYGGGEFVIYLDEPLHIKSTFKAYPPTEGTATATKGSVFPLVIAIMVMVSGLLK